MVRCHGKTSCHGIDHMKYHESHGNPARACSLSSTLYGRTLSSSWRECHKFYFNLTSDLVLKHLLPNLTTYQDVGGLCQSGEFPLVAGAGVKPVILGGCSF